MTAPFRGGHLQILARAFKRGPRGEMAEWLKAHAWKACVRETVPWVRIPLSPPHFALARFVWQATRRKAKCLS